MQVEKLNVTAHAANEAFGISAFAWVRHPQEGKWRCLMQFIDCAI